LSCVLRTPLSPLLAAPTPLSCLLFFFTAPAPTEIYTLSLHDALPICRQRAQDRDHDDRQQQVERIGHAQRQAGAVAVCQARQCRSEEHTSELQSRENLVCRLLLEKKKKRQ